MLIGIDSMTLDAELLGIAYSSRNHLLIFVWCRLGSMPWFSTLSYLVLRIPSEIIGLLENQETSYHIMFKRGCGYHCMTSTCEIIWLKSIFNDLGILHLYPVKLYCDSRSALHLLRIPSFTNELGIKKLVVVRKNVQSGMVKTAYISTSQQPTNMFTKPLELSQSTILFVKLGNNNIHSNLRCVIEKNGWYVIGSLTIYIYVCFLDCRNIWLVGSRLIFVLYLNSCTSSLYNEITQHSTS